MGPSDSPSWLPFPFHGSSAYGVAYAWRHQATRWGLSSSQANSPDIPFPVHRRVLQRCIPSSPRLPWPSPQGTGLGSLFLRDHDAAGFTSCYGLPGRGVIASTVGLLLASDGHYRASWPLPCPNSHRLASLNLSGHDPLLPRAIRRGAGTAYDPVSTTMSCTAAALLSA